MLVLAIDTATPAVTAGVFDGTAVLAGATVLAERVTVDPRAHVELLMSHVTDALTSAGVAMRDLDAIACGTGPGPFTGLRVGMVTAAALGDALEIPVHGVCSLDAVDVTVAEPHLVVTDARRREVYWAAYDADHRRTSGPHVQRPADVTVHGVTCAAGTRLYADVLGLPVVDPEYPSVAGLARAFAALPAGPPAPFLPLYLRRPDAVEPGPRKPVLAGP